VVAVDKSITPALAGVLVLSPKSYEYISYKNQAEIQCSEQNNKILSF